MKQFKVLLVAAVLSLGMAVGSTVYADGFMTQAPTVGTSVTFDYHSILTMGEGEERVTDSEILVSCVGKEDTDDGPAYWIEVKRPNFEQQTMIYKLLIGEKAFAAGTNPFAEVIRGYMRQETAETAQELGEGERAFLIEHFTSPIPYYEKLEGDETEKIKVEALDNREFECKARNGETDFEVFDGELFVMSDGQLWLSDDVPFGMVKARIELDFEMDEGEGSIVSNLVVKKIETKDVKSLLPDSK